MNGWHILMIVGAIVTIGTPIVDLILAFNGIIIEVELSWSFAMTGACLISTGAVCGIGNMHNKTL